MNIKLWYLEYIMYDDDVEMSINHGNFQKTTEAWNWNQYQLYHNHQSQA